MVVFFCLALVALPSAPALAASSWTVRQLPEAPVQVGFYGMSCPSASFCAAVGSDHSVATSTDPTGSASAWNEIHLGKASEGPSVGGRGGTVESGYQTRGVSCPSPNLCVAASLDGNIFSSTDPTGGVSAWNVTALGAENAPRVHMYGISCPSAALCVAVAYGGKIITSTNPTGASSAWTLTQLEDPLDLRGVSCSSEAFCAAVGLGGKIITSTNPTGGASAWKPVTETAGLANLYGISCSTVSLCVGANFGSVVTSTDPASTSPSWNAIGADVSVQVTAISCPSNSECAAVDNNADVIASTDPTGVAGDWSFTNVIPPNGHANGMFGISCPSKSLCVAGGSQGQIIASTEPFGAKTTTPGQPSTPIGHPNGHSKRPRVKIVAHPPARLNLRGGEAVHFRFRAIGRATGFLCSLEGAKFSRCHSPKGYRVNTGEHVFRVKAFGPGGISRAAISRFRVRNGSIPHRLGAKVG